MLFYMMLGFTMLTSSWSCRRLGLDVGFVLVQTLGLAEDLVLIPGSVSKFLALGMQGI